MPDQEAAAAMTRLIKRSKRHSGIQLPSSFARNTSGQLAPLACLIRGGRGGAVRLKLYLSMVLLAGGPHKHPVHGANAIFDVSSPWWARLLGLSDPDGKGTRRIADAQNSLQAMKLVNVQRRSADEPVVRLRRADGSDQPWTRPTKPYITVPRGLWSGGWLVALTAKQLAVLVALLDYQGGREPAPGARHPLEPEHYRWYGMSDDTWRLGSAGLKATGLVDTELEPVQRSFETKRVRKTYRVNLERFEE